MLSRQIQNTRCRGQPEALGNSQRYLTFFPALSFHRGFLCISNLCPKILNLIFLLLNIIDCLRLRKLHVSLLVVQYAQWEKFVIQIVAVGEIQRSPFPSVPKASVAWTSVCINEICHLHCVGFYISSRKQRRDSQRASISPIMPLCVPSCMAQRPNPPDHLWPRPGNSKLKF